MAKYSESKMHSGGRARPGTQSKQGHQQTHAHHGPHANGKFGLTAGPSMGTKVKRVNHGRAGKC